MYTQCFPVACSWYISIVIISVCTSQTIETAVESIEISIEQNSRHPQYCDLYLLLLHIYNGKWNVDWIPYTNHVADVEWARCSCLHEQEKTWNAFILDRMQHFSQQNRQYAGGASNEIRARYGATEYYDVDMFVWGWVNSIMTFQVESPANHQQPNVPISKHQIHQNVFDIARPLCSLTLQSIAEIWKNNATTAELVTFKWNEDH